MYSYFPYGAGIRQSNELAQSALPGAPVVDDENTSAPMLSVRSRSAAWLRAMARGTDHLANRVDPACA
jgi:hypothetical protein